MSFLYAVLGAYLLGQVALGLVSLVRARREDIPAVVMALALWWHRDDAISRRPARNPHPGQQMPGNATGAPAGHCSAMSANASGETAGNQGHSEPIESK